MQNNKEQKAAAIFAFWLFVSFLFALFLFGAIKRFHGPSLTIIPWGQFVFTAWLAVIGGSIHSLMYVILPNKITRSFSVGIAISLAASAITFLMLAKYYVFQTITDYLQPESLVFFYLLVLGVSTGFGATAYIVRR